MRRLLTLLTVCVLLTGVLCIPASAETSASKVDLYCTVTSEGDCQVSMTVTMRLEEAHDQMTFPLPVNAKNITMNHSSVSATKTDSAIEVDISKIARGYVGEASLFFEYTIPKAVKVNADQSSKLIADRTLQLDIPLLCGFEYTAGIHPYIVYRADSRTRLHTQKKFKPITAEIISATL